MGPATFCKNSNSPVNMGSKMRHRPNSCLIFSYLSAFTTFTGDFSGAWGLKELLGRQKVYNFEGFDTMEEMGKVKKREVILKRESTYDKVTREDLQARKTKKKYNKLQAIRSKRAAIQRKLGVTPLKAGKKWMPPVPNPLEEVELRKDGTQELIQLSDNDHKDMEVKRRKRKKGRKRFSMQGLYRALDKVEREEGRQSIMEHFVRTAYNDNNVLKALMNKILPDLKSIDAKIVQQSPYKLILDVRTLATPLIEPENRVKQIESNIIDSIINLPEEEEDE